MNISKRSVFQRFVLKKSNSNSNPESIEPNPEKFETSDLGRCHPFSRALPSHPKPTLTQTHPTRLNPARHKRAFVRGDTRSGRNKAPLKHLSEHTSFTYFDTRNRYPRGWFEGLAPPPRRCPSIFGKPGCRRSIWRSRNSVVLLRSGH